MRNESWEVFLSPDLQDLSRKRLKFCQIVCKVTTNITFNGKILLILITLQIKQTLFLMRSTTRTTTAGVSISGTTEQTTAINTTDDPDES